MRIIVPNSTITNGTIRNLSAETYRRIDLVIGTSYHDDLRAVRQFLEEVVKSDARILADPAPVVAVSELGDSSVNFVVRPWVLSSNYNPVKFHLIEQIKLGFDARGLTIPFPSRDVFVHHSMAQNTLPFGGVGESLDRDDSFVTTSSDDRSLQHFADVKAHLPARTQHSEATRQITHNRNDFVIRG